MSSWKNVPDDISKYQGFVYIITCLKNNKKYIGQKSFWSMENRAIPLVLTKPELLKRAKLENTNFKFKKDYNAALKILKAAEKKRHYSKKRLTRKVPIETKWREYYGSSEQLKIDVAEFGKDNFKREIIWLCTGKWFLSFLELKEQMIANAIFRHDFYNGILNIRLPNVVKEEDFKKQVKVFEPDYS